MRTIRKNDLIVQCFEREISISDFFHQQTSVWKEEFGVSDEESLWLEKSKSELPNYAFLVENLLEQGYELIPITSPNYPRTLKNNLKKTYAPTLIYTKGNICHFLVHPVSRYLFVADFSFKPCVHHNLSSRIFSRCAIMASAISYDNLAIIFSSNAVYVL